MSGLSRRRRPLHTTTVRFDADLWRRLCAVARVMDVPRAQLIRAAVREFVVRVEIDVEHWQRQPDQQLERRAL
jgi:predicted transcriptional regulator